MSENKADTRDSPLMGSDEEYTLDPEEARKRAEARRKKLLEAIEKSSTTHGGE